MRALAVLSLMFSMSCFAAPFAVQVGDARIALDTPFGFADASFTGSPRLQELAESQTSPSNKILMFAISDGDLRRFMVGDTPEFRRYMMVVTPKALEYERLSPATFRELAETIKREAARGEFAELRADAEVYAVQTRALLPPQRRGADPVQVLVTRALIQARGKGLDLSIYSVYESPADLEWIRATTVRWIEDLQRLNAR
ncbi:MAG TPA: hypothetical protein VFC18_21960 [Burkholderiales bacterium]|nr:hypothetical protein [Burkholderiales bacterium]